MIDSASTFRIRYWGTTGSLSAPLKPGQITDKIVQCIEHLLRNDRLSDLKPGDDLAERIERELLTMPFHLRSTFGGNTTSLEVSDAETLFFLDCGSGFRAAGLSLLKRWNDPDYKGKREAEVLITHPHMDHTLATPFFVPFYDPRNTFRVWGTREVLDSLEAVLSPGSKMSSVYFPPTFEQLVAIRELREIKPGQEMRFGETRVKTQPLNHPGGCLAFRMERGDKAFVFATDHEQQQVPDPMLVDFSRGADLLYTEGQYRLSEYEGQQGIPGEPPMVRRGWGHTPVEWCVRTAIAAGVRQLHLGHHDPSRDDEDLSRVEEECQALMKKLTDSLQPEHGECEVRLPYEGMVVDL